MPVTARLSKAFYEKLGEDVANELVDWFNQVDATYRSDLRDVNELNFARFDARLEQRFAQADAVWERRFADMDTRWQRRLAEVRAEMYALRADLIKWMFIFWAGTTFTVLGAVFAIVRL